MAPKLGKLPDEAQLFLYSVKVVCGRHLEGGCCCVAGTRPGVYATEVSIPDRRTNLRPTGVDAGRMARPDATRARPSSLQPVGRSLPQASQAFGIPSRRSSDGEHRARQPEHRASRRNGQRTASPAEGERFWPRSVLVGTSVRRLQGSASCGTPPAGRIPQATGGVGRFPNRGHGRGARPARGSSNLPPRQGAGGCVRKLALSWIWHSLRLLRMTADAEAAPKTPEAGFGLRQPGWHSRC